MQSAWWRVSCSSDTSDLSSKTKKRFMRSHTTRHLSERGHVSRGSRVLDGTACLCPVLDIPMMREDIRVVSGGPRENVSPDIPI
jgi:hypothetical protein